ncbi:MAG: hypothetical protein JWQ81_1195 [Amycolatopsis sp.]|uniref:DUF3558 family protein n=1 Tax=Amycolatopsis sp. TaxID=37632 RepID=UPI00262CE1CD|nr:DUF3558 family protein [Amycolatopsis sp.]MCU1680456.1 hypothetical protein [Amycolatopsis sp.]
MSSFLSRALPGACVLLGLVALAGCGAAASQSAAPPAAPSAATPSYSAAQSAKPTLATLEPCDLLSSSDRSSAGLSALGKDKTIGAARACDWTEPGSFGVTVTLDGSSGLSDLAVSRGTSRKIKVGAHSALQVADKKAADGTCAVLLGIGASASAQVDVSNTSFTGTDLACRRANTVAGLIEPKLP